MLTDDEDDKQQARVTTLLDALPDIVLGIVADGTLVYANHAAERGGWSISEWIGRSVLDLVHPGDVALAASAMGTIQGKDHGTAIELRILHPKDGWRWFEVIGSDHLTDPTLGFVVLVCRDLTERRRWEVAHDDVARFQAIVHHAASVTLLLDADGCIHSASGAVSRLLGLDPELLADEPFSTMAAPGYERVLEAALVQARADGRVSVEVPVVRGDHDTPPGYHFDIVDLTADPVVAGFVVTGHDVSELHRARQALHDRQRIDTLTGLPNRRGLTERLEEALAERAPDATLALVVIDIDGFQSINDIDGHDSGDRLLTLMAQRISAVMRASDLVARVGGDQFAVVACDLPTLGTVDYLVDRIRRAVRLPFPLLRGDVRVSVSLGVSMARRDDDADRMLANAESAMRETKTEHAGSSSAGRDVTERRALARALHAAVRPDGQGIEAWLQPVLSIATGAVTGYEALVRWRRAAGEVLGPGQFLELAESLDLGRAIDMRVLHGACGQLAQLHPGPIGPWVAVNLTPVDLADPDLPARVRSILAEYDLPPDRLAIEVTEQTMLERVPRPNEVSPSATLRRLAGEGVRIVLDDFGTGYSSLTHVRDLRPRAVKIDRSFVRDITTDATSRVLVAAVVALCKALGLSTVAEGVETQAQLDAVAALGCESVQGFLYSPALPLDQLIAWEKARVPLLRSILT